MLYKSVESTNGAHHHHHRHLMMIIIIIVIIIINIVIVVVSVAADDAAAADIIIMSSSRIISGSSNIIIFASSLFKCREASGIRSSILPCERYSVDIDRTECDLISPERYRPRYIVEQKGKKRGSAATHDLVARKG